MDHEAPANIVTRVINNPDIRKTLIINDPIVLHRFPRQVMLHPDHVCLHNSILISEMDNETAKNMRKRLSRKEPIDIFLRLLSVLLIGPIAIIGLLEYIFTCRSISLTVTMALYHTESYWIEPGTYKIVRTTSAVGLEKTEYEKFLRDRNLDTIYNQLFPIVTTTMQQWPIREVVIADENSNAKDSKSQLSKNMI